MIATNFYDRPGHQPYRNWEAQREGLINDCLGIAFVKDNKYDADVGVAKGTSYDKRRAGFKLYRKGMRPHKHFGQRTKLGLKKIESGV